MTGHPFRFGVVAAQARTGEEWTEKVRRIESMGYATVLTPDGLKYTLAPLPALTAAAMATRSLRVGTYVIANDFRSPVMLAKEAATLDLLSGGRFELGIGVGRPAAADDNRMLGIAFDPGGVRVARLAESLALLKALLSGQAATAAGRTMPPQEQRSRRVPSSSRGRPSWSAPASDVSLSWRRARRTSSRSASRPPSPRPGSPNGSDGSAAAGPRFEQLELNLNLMAVGQQVPRWIASQMGLTAESLARAGAASALMGTTDRMVETLRRRRESLGISYIAVADELMEGLAPVVERLAGH